MTNHDNARRLKQKNVEAARGMAWGFGGRKGLRKEASLTNSDFPVVVAVLVPAGLEDYPVPARVVYEQGHVLHRQLQHVRLDGGWAGARVG